MKTDSKFNKLSPEQYIDDLGANYTRLQYVRDKVEEGFEISEETAEEEHKLGESLTKMLDEDAHVEISYEGRRLFIDEVECFISDSGVKKVVIYVSNEVKY